MNQPSTPPAAGPAEESGLDFGKRGDTSTWKETLSRPSTAAAIIIGIGLAGLVAYLQFGNPEAGLPPPQVSYSLLPNEGRTKGVPIAIKLNQVAVFQIDDPLAGESGATRAKALVENLQQAIDDLKAEPGKAITFVTDSGTLPAIVLQDPDGANRRTLVQLTEGDVALSGAGDAKRVARVWAERLTDTLKVLAFGEPPEFSVGTEFGHALEALYAAARSAQGSISRGSLDEAFLTLTDAQRLVLETVPTLEPGESVTTVSNASRASGQ